MPLVTAKDLRAASKSDPSRTVAELCVERMRNAADPMPPGGPLPDAQVVNALEKWIQSGFTDSGCSTSKPTEVTPNPTTSTTFTGASVCTSGTHYVARGGGSATMHPGMGCMDCHGSGKAPAFAIAGTVYPTGHEPTDCNGSSGNGVLKVILTDSAKKTVTLSVNSVGNFYYAAQNGLTPPYQVKVQSGNQERVMATTAPNGNCNSCHTESGTNGAPGRIAAP